MLRAALVGGLLLLVGMASAQDVGPIKTENDVQYGQVGDVKLHLDIARPEKLDKPAPCIVIIHGGGWRGGNRMAHRAADCRIRQAGLCFRDDRLSPDSASFSRPRWKM